jgi:predicted ester cyclase
MTEENKKIVSLIADEIWNKGNLTFCDEIMSEDAKYNGLHMPNGAGTRANWKQATTMYRNAFPDWNEKIEFMIAEDGKVGTGTNTGKLGEMNPTGKSIKIQNLIVHRIDENNQTAETWVLWDNVAFLPQLGLYPPATE